jgi:hypothetical protein
VKLLAFLLLAASSGGAAEAQAGRCYGASDARLGENRLRPRLAALCDYDAAEVNRRLLRLLALQGSDLSIEAVEAILSLPPLFTAYDDRHRAIFAATLRGTPRRGGHSVGVSFHETFRPASRGAQTGFRGRARPIRIDPQARGEVSVYLDWEGPTPIEPGSAACLPPPVFAAEARRQGWRERSEPDLVPIPHGPPPGYRLIFERSGARTIGTIARGGACILSFSIHQEGYPPLER